MAGGAYKSKYTFWGSRSITTKGRELAQTIQENNYSFISMNKIMNLLFFVTNGISIYTDASPNFDLTSDHSPIIATLSTTVMNNTPTLRIQNSRTNWDT